MKDAPYHQQKNGNRANHPTQSHKRGNKLHFVAYTTHQLLKVTSIYLTDFHANHRLNDEWDLLKKQF